MGRMSPRPAIRRIRARKLLESYLHEYPESGGFGRWSHKRVDHLRRIGEELGYRKRLRRAS